MSIKSKFIQYLSLLLIISITISCSTFKTSSQQHTSSTGKDHSEERYKSIKKSYDSDKSSRLFSSEDFEETAMDNIPESDNDSTIIIESYEFADSLLSFSYAKMNDSKIAEELVKESRSLFMLDSLTTLKFFKDDEYLFDRNRQNIFNFEEGFVPIYSDSVYRSRIEKLNRKTPLEFTYNETVKSYIEVYGVRKRGLTSRILGLAEVYFPMFEEILDQYNLPLELKYLAVVESALNPLAGSPVGAKGLWQFMYGTGKMYGLELNSYVDDRYDPYKSTIAACQHLQDLYDIYQDWWLVLAAYNSGGGNVNKAIRRAGGVKNYWAIWPYLPRETRGYVPAFIAVSYLMNYTAEHNLYAVHPGILYNAIDTVHVHDALSFEQISEVLGISKEDLKYLNPSFKEGIIPATSDNKYVLRLPRSLSGYYVSKESEIYNHKTQKGIEREKLITQIDEMPKYQVHTVKSGETLGGIAKKYKTSVSGIQSLNKMKGTTIHPGQKLYVSGTPPKSGGTPAKASNSTATASSSTSNAASGEKSTHTVKKGENLGSIASRYNCTVNDLKSWNNLKSNTIHINQKLVVYKPATSQNSQDASASVAGKSADGYIYHIVKPGDTLWDIAKKYNGVTVEELKKLNNITNSQSLKVGQKIKIASAG